MPGGVVLLVELLFNIGSDVLLDVELLQRHVGTVNCILLHLLIHICMLDHSFSLSRRHQLNKIKYTNRSTLTHPQKFIFYLPLLLTLIVLLPCWPLNSWCYYVSDGFRSYVEQICIYLMISIEQERKNRPTFIELKNAINIGEKERKLQKLGGSIKASIEKLRRLKTDILAESNVRRLAQLLSEYEKENLYYNQLQKSLVEIDEQSAMLDRIKQMNKQFIDTHQPEQLQKKLQFMKNERTSQVNIESSVEMAQINEQQLSGQILASNKQELRRKMLQQQQDEIDQIDVLVNRIHKIALDTGNMILQQGMKLQIAASTMSKVKNNFKNARVDLAQANEYQQDTNKKLITCCLLLVLIVSVVVMIYYASSKKKAQ